MLWSLLATSLCVGISYAGPQWHEESGFRWAELNVPTSGRTGFRLLSPEETGIYFTNTLDERTFESRSRIFSNGSGVAVGDFDNDGLPDLFFCSLSGENALYKNLGGMRFKDVTRNSGILCSNEFCTGAVFADINGDGFLDLLVATVGAGVRVFLNNGSGHFSDVTSSAGTGSKYCSMSMALADIDGNGSLDLYVANYRTNDIRDQGQVDLQMVNGKLIIPPSLRDRFVLINGRVHEYGEPDVLYLNDGHGHFTPLSWTNGAFLDEDGKALTSAPLDWGLAATFRDINGDGAPDLYVCNDYWTPDRIWINDGHGYFRAAPRLAFRHTSHSSMGVDCADLTRSGKVDIFVADMLSRDLQLAKRQMPTGEPAAADLGQIDNRPQITRNTLFVNQGDRSFAEIADYAGVSASDWSSSPIFIDVDLDGYEDLLIAAGHLKDVQDLDAAAEIRSRTALSSQRLRNLSQASRAEAFLEERIQNSHLYPALDMPIVAFHNLGHYQFKETTSLWGTDTPGIHNGLAYGDLDGDGDLDLVVNNFGSAAGIYRNETPAPRIAVRLKGNPPNTQGIGAKIKLLEGAVPLQSQEIISGGHYMAGSEPLAVFAAGQATGGMVIEVTWRTGKKSAINGVRPNRIYEVNEQGAQETQTAIELPSAQMFEDVSDLLAHAHHQEEFNDFARQPLLPRKLSRAGPAVAWADLDGDGWDDLVLGSGKGGRMAIYRNNGHSGFERMSGGALDKVVEQDQSGIVVCASGTAPITILAGSDNYSNPSRESKLLRYLPQGRIVDEPLNLAGSSIGPLALGDMDGNGNLVLFVGGRAIPGHYPEAASSGIYRLRGDQWCLDDRASLGLERVGLVNGAVWSDLDGDGFPELILACEWGPIRVFKTAAGRLREITSELGLDKYLGWWNGVTTGDLDGSGRMSIVASNWGLNTPYQATKEHPIALYYGDFGASGTVDLVEAQYDPTLAALTPRRKRDPLSAALPDLTARFPTHKAFSIATIDQVLGDHKSQAHNLQVNLLASTVFLNRGDRFEPHPLPPEAQFAPAFGVIVADFDGDGFEDVFLSQNSFANQPEIPRYDSGRGLLLAGDGAGHFKPVPGHKSGILVYGEQRGAAIGDYDQDGRVDLAISQNAAPTKLFHNVTAKPGLRVRLIGPPGNPQGIGAQIRLLFGSHPGPAREIHAGGGYWSQDSPVAVLALPQPASTLWVRWPGGRVSTTAISGGSRNLAVSFDGKLAPR